MSDRDITLILLLIIALIPYIVLSFFNKRR